ncbi:hypothetical protein V2J09_021110 [Rumex salicifolius]
MSLLPQDIQLPKPPSSPSSSSPSPPMTTTFKEKGKLEEIESDDDLFTVPDMDETRIHESNEKEEESTCSPGDVSSIPVKKKRGRTPVDKEYRRIKRLLRNRVSAQEARERKKVYVNDLEWKEKELQDHNFQLQEKISTLVNENSMLRKHK